jgi:uncharacterized NAD(P)/FAD-binding protein YdhS
VKRVCVIGAGPCGLTAVKNLLRAGCRDVVCYEESDGIGGNWAYTDDPGRASVHDCTHTISSKHMSAFDDFPMPDHYPDFPAHRQLLAYFADYARSFGLSPYIRLGTRVDRCTLGRDGRWTVHAAGDVETFDYVLVCSGHHREPFVPEYPGRFTGTVVHSSAYKRPDPLRGQRVLVVGAGNSAADIAVDVARLASYTAISMRAAPYFVPKLVFGRPVDVVHAFWRNKLPEPLLRSALKLWLRLAVGRWEDYGLPPPTGAALSKPPTVNSSVLDALRHGRLAVRPGIERYDGQSIRFRDGTEEAFDTVVMATGFRVSFPFLSQPLPPLHLRMMHPATPSLYFIGLFQPIGCIWRLADDQARIAALQISGQLPLPRDPRTPHHALTVDYHRFRRELRRELGRELVRELGRSGGILAP